MKRLMFRLFALCLALSWVPATAHCRLQALGMEFAACSANCGDEASPHHGADAANQDGCDLVENGFYKASVGGVKVPAPIVALCACLLCLFVPEAIPDARLLSTAAEAEEPQEWVAQWPFVRRAAALAHAPDALLA
jgi:hypothetical protein